MSVFAQEYHVAAYSMTELAKDFSEFQKAKKFEELVNPDMIDAVVVTLTSKNMASTFEVRFRDPEYRLLDNIDLVFKDAFLRIDGGAVGDVSTVMPYGFITSIEPRFDDKSYPTVTVKGSDESAVLATIGAKEGRRANQETLDQVVSKIAKSRGFTYEIVDSTEKRRLPLTFAVPASVPDRTLLDELAKKLGYDFRVQAGKILFVRVLKDEGNVQKLAVYQKFYYRAGEQTNLREVRIKTEKQSSRYGKRMGDIPSLQTTNILDKEQKAVLEANQAIDRAVPDANAAPAAQGSIPALKNSKHTMDAELLYGDVGFLPGYNVEVHGIGKAFSGQWTVTKVRHSWGKEGFHTTFTAERGFSETDQHALADPENMEHADPLVSGPAV